MGGAGSGSVGGGPVLGGVCHVRISGGGAFFPPLVAATPPLDGDDMTADLRRDMSESVPCEDVVLSFPDVESEYAPPDLRTLLGPGIAPADASCLPLVVP